jgi:lysozyme family protein
MYDEYLAKLLELEGDQLAVEPDGQGHAYRGVTTRWYPHLKDKIVNKTLTDDEIRQIYLDDYYNKIYGVSWLEVNAPDMAWLLFIGSVHGTGDNDYTRVVQQYLSSLTPTLVVDGIWGPNTFSAFKNASPYDRQQLMTIIRQLSHNLANQRATAVGSVGNGIRNRVYKEISLASNFASVSKSISEATLVADGDEVDKEWTSYIKLEDSDIYLRRV